MHTPRNLVRTAATIVAVVLFTQAQCACSQVRDGMVHLSVKIVDGVTAQPIPVRVRITQGQRVVKVLPPQALSVMYGLWDHADAYGFQPDSAFYVDGGFTLKLPAGDYTITLSKGIEYLEQQHNINIRNNEPANLLYATARWIDMPARRWYSADDHIHIRRSPREDSVLLRWIQTEDIHAGVLLRHALPFPRRSLPPRAGANPSAGER